MWWIALIACGGGTGQGDTGAVVEPLELSADPSEPGVPVGVRTVQWEGRALEVWYPASDRTEGAPEAVDLGGWLPDSVTERLDGLELPPVPTRAVRDAPIRQTGERLPLIVFSHGFGGMRVQSVDLTSHLASRGYVVVATDHAGRSVAELLPCLFQPPAEGCALAFDDPAPPDVDAILAWAGAAGPFEAVIDVDRIGLFGHSAGGGTTTTVGEADPRIDAILPMAGGGVVQRDVPALYLAGACDSTVPAADTRAAAAASGAPYVEVAGAGHLAFSDLCTLDLAALAAPLEGRDDVNPTFLDLVTSLGTDGCVGATPTVDGCDAYADPATTAAPIRHVVTAHFDRHLRSGADDPVGDWPALTLEGG